MTVHDVKCPHCGKTFDRNRYQMSCPHLSIAENPHTEAVSTETAYGRTVAYPFSLKVF